MIAWLNGQIVEALHPGKLVVDVNGVGYDVETSLPTFSNLESQAGKISLHIHTIVREDAFLLYGFSTHQERALFRALIKVNGVGPKMAIAILSSASPNEFLQCINQNNVQLLTRLPGIGKKTAERLIVEMKDSLKNISHMNTDYSQENSMMRPQDEAIKALESLGYKAHEALKAVKKIEGNHHSCEQLIRQALQILAMA